MVMKSRAELNRPLRLMAATAAVAALTLAPLSAASADSLKDQPHGSDRQFSFSATIGGTTDYVFRGVSQTDEDPTVQGSVDASYGIFYAGVWASGVEFAEDPGDGTGDAVAEIDFYAGITPTLGPISFDAGVIYYAYPGADDPDGEFDYVELKLGASTTFQKFGVGVTAFYSPEFFGEVGEAVAIEGTASYELPSIGPATPTISGLYGRQDFLEVGGGTDYDYWNAGVAFAFDKIELDVRYWDSEAGCGSLCDERVVGSVKLTLP